MQVISAEKAAVETIALQPEDSPETLAEKIRTVLNSFEPEDVKILLTDVPFGSTTQTAIPFLAETENLYIVSGTNLGLLMGILMEPFEEGNVTEKLHELIDQSKATLSLINDMMNESDEDEEEEE
jgi:PTS system mannose-specific IIA component